MFVQRGVSLSLIETTAFIFNIFYKTKVALSLKFFFIIQKYNVCLIFLLFFSRWRTAVDTC